MIASSLVLHHQNVKIILFLFLFYFILKREAGMHVWTYTIIGPMVNVFLYAMQYAVGQWPVLGF
jgi:multisubunit Na+/H+ antiporter MnhC subunit